MPQGAIAPASRLAPDAPGIQLRDFKALAAAFGDQALPVQQMQRVGDGLARHPELFRKFALRMRCPVAACGP